MRPALLNPLFASLSSLKGIGPAWAKTIEILCGPRVLDLLWHLPVQVIQRPFYPSLQTAPVGKMVTLLLEIGRHQPNAIKSKPYKVIVSDASGFGELMFFHVRGDYLTKLLPFGAKRLISGKLESYGGRPQITHPDYIVQENEAAKIPAVEPVYGLTAGLANKTVVKSVQQALQKLPSLPEWQDAALLKKQAWPDWTDAMQSVHHPVTPEDILPQSRPRERLAYDELLANQLALALVRRAETQGRGRVVPIHDELRKKALAVLPFQLTGAQVRSLAEIDADLDSEARMLRLLQGDVGSGKTVVAFLAALNAVGMNAQTAIMAPTEILARQHYETIAPLAEKLGVKVAVLTGRDSGKAREELLQQIKNGDVKIIIGTHAIIQDSVEFNDLALAVIDEQHRFGVQHRLTLSDKGKGTNILVMTATPIPRTLTLTAYGDMDISLLNEKPPGRQKIETRVLSLDKMPDVVQGVERHIQDGAQIYWVCPLVEESEKLDLIAAEKRHETLVAHFGDTIVGLLHGRMKPKDKDAVMADFSSSKIKILVSTTVIEVGINVPTATVMIIEHAERFGLAQLHQLRGRVGRGKDQSHCLLLYGKPLGETSKARLQIMRETDDGFRIAEEDLRLRGAGEVLGTRQSGMATFRLADLSAHAELLQIARDETQLILNRDPDLQSERGQALRTLLYLFGLNEAVRYLRSG